MFCFSCSQCAADGQSGQWPRGVGALFRVNGTPVPDGITFRPFSMAGFTAYFDGSGSPHDTPVVAVAGFIATTEQWPAL
jgi:hypothetical protein